MGKKTPSFQHQFNVSLKDIFETKKKYIHKVITAKKKMNKITNIENIGIDSSERSFVNTFYIYATSHFPNFIITTDASRLYCWRLLGLCCRFFFSLSVLLSWQNGKLHLADSHFYYFFASASTNRPFFSSDGRSFQYPNPNTRFKCGEQ